MKFIKNLLIIFALLLIIIFIRFSSITNYFSFQNLQLHKIQLLNFINNSYFLSVIAYIASFCLVNLLMLPVAASFSIFGGFLFGIVPGAIYINIVAVLSSVSAFLISKYLVGNYIQQKYQNSLTNFNNNLKKNKISYMFAIRFSPFLPFSLINYLAGLTKINLSTFLWTTSLGVIPASLVYVFAGTQINNINKISDIFSFKILLAFSMLAILSLIPAFLKKIRRKKIDF